MTKKVTKLSNSKVQSTNTISSEENFAVQNPAYYPCYDVVELPAQPTHYIGGSRETIILYRYPNPVIKKPFSPNLCSSSETFVPAGTVHEQPQECEPPGICSVLICAGMCIFACLEGV